MRPLTSLAAVALLATTFAACAPADEATDDTDSTTSAEPSAADDCTPDTMETIADATLTIATDDPAYEPWFVDNDPTNGEGYEAAVGYAIAEQLGYSDDQVTWVKVPFNKVVQPGPKEFDFDLNQVSITEARRKAVDFSSGYYDVSRRSSPTPAAPSTGSPRSPSWPTPSSVPRSARPATPRSPTRSSRPRTPPSSTPTTRPSRRSRTARSTASSSTCPPPTS